MDYLKVVKTLCLCPLSGFAVSIISMLSVQKKTTLMKSFCVSIGPYVSPIITF